jgi:hypothetical protein
MDLTQLLDLTTFSQAFSSNAYVSALVMILLNVGTSYLMQDLMPIAHRIFSVVWVRRLVFFAIFFTATRDLKVSVLLMVVFTLLVDIFLNEDSEYCLIPYEHRLPRTPLAPQPQHQPQQPARTTESFRANENTPSNTHAPPTHSQSQTPNDNNNNNTSRLERFRQNAERWSLSRRPVSYW